MSQSGKARKAKEYGIPVWSEQQLWKCVGIRGEVMGKRVFRSVEEPIREGLTRAEMWDQEDKGLIWLWELGRSYRRDERTQSKRAEQGELPVGDWKGGVDKKLKAGKKSGSLQYLAQWQGMRGENLSIDVDAELTLICSRTGQSVVFSSTLTDDE